MSRIPKEIVQAIWERSAGLCELNVDDIPIEAAANRWVLSGRMAFHHRQARAMGGSKRDQDTAANLLWLHQECHEYVHAHPEWARLHGYIVSQYVDTP